MVGELPIMETIDKIETDIASYYIENDILIMRTKQDADITLEAAKEGVEARKKLQQGRKMLALIDTSKVFQVSREVREYGATKEVVEMCSAMAVLTGTSLPATIIGNFFIKFNKPKVPTKLFRSEKKALAWLETYR